MKFYASVWLLLLWLININSSNAQEQRFTAGIIAGLNLSQIDGDLAAGYEHFGLVAGLRGGAILSKKSELSIELLFSQRGSQSDLFRNTSVCPFRIQLNYIGVPVLFNFKDWEVEGKDKTKYHKMHFTGGFSYGRLINTNTEGEDTICLPPVSESFRQNDVSIVLGATFYMNQKIGFTLRWNRSLNLLYKRDETSSLIANNFLTKFLTFHTVYML